MSDGFFDKLNEDMRKEIDKEVLEPLLKDIGYYKPMHENESEILKSFLDVINDNEPKCYLQNQTAGYLGNSPYWWARGGCGYTDNIDEAELMSVKDADTIINSTRGSHVFVKWTEEEIKSATYRVVDIQKLRKMSQ